MEQKLTHLNFERLISGGNVLLLIINLDFIIIEASDAWCQELGFKRQNVIGKSCVDFVDEHQQNEIHQILSNLKEGASDQVTFDYQTKNENSDAVWLKSKAYVDGDFVVITFNNISPLIKAKSEYEKLINIHNVVLDTITFGLYYVKNTKVIWANNSFYKIFDTTPDEILNKDLVLFYNKVEDFHRIYAEAYETLVKGEIYQGEVELRMKPGQIDWVRFIGKTLEPGHPKEGGTVWLIEIITEQKRNEEYLKLFKLSNDFAGDAIYWMDKDANFIYVNDESCRMLGYSHEELMQCSLYDINHYQTKEQWDFFWTDIQSRKHEKNVILKLESIQHRKNGEEFPVEITAHHFWIEENEYHMVYVRDITEHKNNELRLNKFKMSIDNALDGVYWINRTGGFDYVNEQACKMLGYSQEELISLKLPDIDYSYSLEQFAKDWEEAFRVKETYGVNNKSVQVKKDGTFIPVEVNAIFIWDEDDSFIIVYIKDISERQQHEDLILKNQKLLIESQRIAKMGSWEFDIKTGKLTWNKEAFEIYGYEYNEVEPSMELFYRLINPNDVQSAVDHFQYILEHKEVQDFECRILDWEGKDKFLLVAGDVESDENGNLIRIFGIVQDITEKKNNEQQLIQSKLRAEESEERFRALHNASFGGIAIHDKGIILDCNQGLSEITGYGFDELIYKNGLLLMAPEYRELVMSKIKSGAEKPYIVKGLKKNGETYPLRLEARNIPYKGKQVRSVEFRDITEQIQAEQEIVKAKERAEESEYFLQESQRSGNIGSFKLNIQRQEWIATETLFRIVGENNKSCSYLEISELIHSKDRQLVKNYFVDEVLSLKKPFDIEFRVIRKSDQELRWVHAVGKLYLDEKDEVVEILGTLQDITDRKLIEEERKKMNVMLENSVKERTEQLQQANHDLEAFAYSVSHDLRAPIRHIDGFLRLMYNALKPVDDKVQGYYDKILKSSTGMSVMIDELLRFSRLGRTKISYTEVDLKELVLEVVEQFKPDYAHRNIQWNIQSLPMVKGDPVLLKIVYENLISNAIKYTSKCEQAIVEIGHKENDSGKYELYVQDNGAGFDMAYKDKLFGVFQRLHKSEEFEGIGIGLANVKQIITKHNGTIDAQSEIDKGTKFIIYLPK